MNEVKNMLYNSKNRVPSLRKVLADAGQKMEQIPHWLSKWKVEIQSSVNRIQDKILHLITDWKIQIKMCCLTIYVTEQHLHISEKIRMILVDIAGGTTNSFCKGDYKALDLNQYKNENVCVIQAYFDNWFRLLMALTKINPLLKKMKEAGEESIAIRIQWFAFLVLLF
ncbi:MAG: hypothetical protein AAGA60_01130 [Cyanobacteria bacterium P01_E01_bin.42]